MPIKISQLPVATSPTGAELVPIVQGGVTKQTNLASFALPRLAAPSGSSLVGFLQDGAGAVATTMQTKLRESVSVLDFGADPTGSTDSQVAITKAITSLGVAGGTVFFPKGIYAISTPIAITTDDVSLVGVGIALGNTGVSILGGTVIKVTAAVNAISVTTPNISNFSCENLYIVSAVVGVTALSIDGTGSINNLYLRKVYVQGMANAIYLGAAAGIVHAHIEFCQFGYNTAEHVILTNGSNINSILFVSCRFEPAGNGSSLIKATGSARATGSAKFINCVFESANAVRAVDCGDNAVAWSFIGCHFENNAAPISAAPVNSGCDVYVGGGQSNVLFQGCNFSYPYATATNFYNILSPAGARIIASNNTVAGQGHTGYLGFISNSFDAYITLISNVYLELGAPSIDYSSGMINPVKINDNQATVKYGSVNGPIVKSVTTTNATPTRVWGGLYQFQASLALFAVADVVGTDVTGAIYCAFTTRVLVTADAAGAATMRGTSTEIGIASGTQAAVFALTGGVGTAGLELRVTGISGITIKWVANVTLNKIGF